MSKITARAAELDSFAMRLQTVILNHKIETGCAFGDNCPQLASMKAAARYLRDAAFTLHHAEDETYRSVLGSGHLTREEWEAENAWFSQDPSRDLT